LKLRSAWAHLDRAAGAGDLALKVVIDTSVLIDHLRSHAPATGYITTLEEQPVCSEVRRASHPGIGIADLAIAATAEHITAPLVTCNVKHFPMFAGLQAPY
jgi:predicted nucleic acid-binding protein